MHTVYDRLARNCIPCLGQTFAKSYTLFRTARTKTIPCHAAAHPRIGHIRGVPPPPPHREDANIAGTCNLHRMAELPVVDCFVAEVPVGVGTKGLGE